MPIYEFECKKCKQEYSELTEYDESGKYPGVKCPHCKSKRKTRIFGGIGAVIFTNPEGTDNWNKPEWKFGYKLDKAKAERRAAEEKSHMGAVPYRPDNSDIESGKYFGEVK
jgi:putative FmdB family regulatory protein